MKRTLVSLLIGAAAGGAAILIAWLYGPVSQLSPLPFEDILFGVGLVLLLIGLICLTRPGKGSSAIQSQGSASSAGTQTAVDVNLTMEEQKAMDDPKLAHRKKAGNGLFSAGIILTVAGIIPLIVFAARLW